MFLFKRPFYWTIIVVVISFIAVLWRIVLAGYCSRPMPLFEAKDGHLDTFLESDTFRVFELVLVPCLVTFWLVLGPFIFTFIPIFFYKIIKKPMSDKDELYTYITIYFLFLIYFFFPA